jgi:hypothetical protein
VIRAFLCILVVLATGCGDGVKYDVAIAEEVHAAVIAVIEAEIGSPDIEEYAIDGYPCRGSLDGSANGEAIQLYARWDLGDQHPLDTGLLLDAIEVELRRRSDLEILEDKVTIEDRVTTASSQGGFAKGPGYVVSFSVTTSVIGDITVGVGTAGPCQ